MSKVLETDFNLNQYTELREIIIKKNNVKLNILFKSESKWKF